MCSYKSLNVSNTTVALVVTIWCEHKTSLSAKYEPHSMLTTSASEALLPIALHSMTISPYKNGMKTQCVHARVTSSSGDLNVAPTTEALVPIIKNKDKIFRMMRHAILKHESQALALIAM